MHARQSKPIVFDPCVLNPLNSENDTDPISLEKIYEEDLQGVRQISSRTHDLFTYVMESGGKKYQRTLQLSSLRDLLKNNITKDPFSNEPFPEEVINRARARVEGASAVRRRSYNEEHNMRMNRIIDFFQRIGYIINPTWVCLERKSFFLSWYHEVNHLWLSFRRDNPEVSVHVFPAGILPYINPTLSKRQVAKHITKTLLTFMETSFMSVMIVLSALAWVSEDVRHAYPDLAMI